MALAAPSERDIPRNPMANTFAKQVTARPAVNASMAPEIANTILIGIEATNVERRASWKTTIKTNGGPMEMPSAFAAKKFSLPKLGAEGTEADTACRAHLLTVRSILDSCQDREKRAASVPAMWGDF